MFVPQRLARTTVEGSFVRARPRAGFDASSCEEPDAEGGRSSVGAGGGATATPRMTLQRARKSSMVHSTAMVDADESVVARTTRSRDRTAVNVVRTDAIFRRFGGDAVGDGGGVPPRARNLI